MLDVSGSGMAEDALARLFRRQCYGFGPLIFGDLNHIVEGLLSRYLTLEPGRRNLYAGIRRNTLGLQPSLPPLQLRCAAKIVGWQGRKQFISLALRVPWLPMRSWRMKSKIQGLRTV